MEFQERNKKRLKRDLIICKANLHYIDTALAEKSQNPFSYHSLKEHQEDREKIIHSIKMIEEKISLIENLGY